KKGGGSTVAAIGDMFVNGGGAFDLATGKYLGPFPAVNVLTKDAIYGYQDGAVKTFDHDRAARGAHRLDGVACMIRAGSRLYLGTPKKVVGISLPLTNDELAVDTEIDI